MHLKVFCISSARQLRVLNKYNLRYILHTLHRLFSIVDLIRLKLHISRLNTPINRIILHRHDRLGDAILTLPFLIDLISEPLSTIPASNKSSKK